MNRKILFKLLTLAAVITIGLVVYSCQKEQVDIGKSENQTEQSLADVQLEKRIIAFRDKIDLIRENPALKSGTDPMEIEEAVWYIEATSNLTYGDASPEMDGFVIDSAFVSVPITNGQILWTDIQIAYDEVVDYLSDHFAAIIASEKQLVVADLAIEEIANGFVVIKINSGFAVSGSATFGANDHSWYWGWELGRCDNIGVGVGYDAADKIAELANLSIIVPSGNSYYTDVWWEESTGLQHATTSEDGLFEDYQEYTLVHACLSPTHITAYKNNLISIGILLCPTSEYSVIHYNLEDWTANGIVPGGNSWAMSHHADIKYGIWHLSSDPPNDL